MKKYLLTVACVFMLLTSCDDRELPTSDSGANAAETVSMTLAAAADTEPAVTEAAVAAGIPTAEARVIIEAVYGETEIAVIGTSGGKISAALKLQDGYEPFYNISEGSYPYENTVTLQPFSDILGESGVQLYYGTGANAAENCFFTFDDGVPSLLVKCGNTAIPVGEYLIDQSDAYGRNVVLYGMSDGKLRRTDLTAEVMARYPDTKDMYMSYRANMFYESREGLFLIDILPAGEQYFDHYAGWLEEGELCVVSEADMVLPEYTYTPTEFAADAAGVEWLTERRMDFVLRDEIDPTTLGRDELEAYMAEAYNTGMAVLAIYSMDSGMLFGGDYLAGDTMTYYSGGRYYNDMQNPAFPSLDAWETYMRRILSDDIVDRLMERDTFIELDGKLYGQLGASGTDPTLGAVESEITSVTDTDITYVDKVEILGDLVNVTDTKTIEFHYSKTENGWRWTELTFYH